MVGQDVILIDDVGVDEGHVHGLSPFPCLRGPLRAPSANEGAKDLDVLLRHPQRSIAPPARVLFVRSDLLATCSPSPGKRAPRRPTPARAATPCRRRAGASFIARTLTG